ncbi:MAG TPA: hypothetical protein VE244_08795 [Nitrososphaeraceae archaeon]|nr:hypothetical protein [Nitrososphaeraceae archaeon]
MDNFTAYVPSSRHVLALVAVSNQIYVINRGPEPNITVSVTNQIFHIGTDDQKMMIGSKLINVKK